MSTISLTHHHKLEPNILTISKLTFTCFKTSDLAIVCQVFWQTRHWYRLNLLCLKWKYSHPLHATKSKEQTQDPEVNQTCKQIQIQTIGKREQNSVRTVHVNKTHFVFVWYTRLDLWLETFRPHIWQMTTSRGWNQHNDKHSAQRSEDGQGRVGGEKKVGN